jgi:hypothetical protein
MIAAPDNTTADFDSVTAVADLGNGEFAALLSPEWTIVDRPNGGYLLAILGRAAVTMTPHDHVITASAHYLRSPDPGPVTVSAELLRSGRSVSQVRAGMSQEGRTCVEALITTGQLDPGVRPFWKADSPDSGGIPFADGVPLAPRTPAGGRVAIHEQVAVRLDPDSLGFMDGRPAGRGELRGWLSLPGGSPFDPVSLLFALDALPPASVDIEFTGWVPTLALSAYVRAAPAPGPVRVLQRTHLIDGGRFDEACFIWDRMGRLVAHGSQLAAIRLG